MIVTGCRRGEIMGLKWENVDLESRMICVRETLLAVETGVYQDTPKTRESHRYINIPSETADLLREYRRSQYQIRTILGDRWEGTGYVFTQENGLPMHPDSINGWLNHFSERHGLPHINPHAFRHSIASILINSGTDILSISKRLGYANTSTTRSYPAKGRRPNLRNVLPMYCYVKILSRRRNRMTMCNRYDKMRADMGGGAMLTLYHGSTQIVAKPEIRTNKYRKDFYWGFYSTQIEAQAVRWTTRRGQPGIVNLGTGQIQVPNPSDQLLYKKALQYLKFERSYPVDVQTK